MTRTSFTPEQREQALALYAEHGAGEAARRTGIPRGTISSWARRAGVATTAAPVATPEALGKREQVRHATEAAAATMQQRKAQLAEDVEGQARRVLAQLFAPCVEKKIVTIAGGLQHDGRWAVAELEREQPSFADQKAIATTFAILVDKLQVLTGGATQRFAVEGDREVEDVAAEVLHLVRGERSA